MSEPVVQTATGPITPGNLGRTLMHEHLVIGYPGWDADTIRPGPSANESSYGTSPATGGGS